MCVACLEYIKDRLTDGEFKTALKETTIDNPKHLAEVEKVVRANAGKPEAIKRELKALQ